MIAIDIRGVIN